MENQSTNTSAKKIMIIGLGVIFFTVFLFLILNRVSKTKKEKTTGTKQSKIVPQETSKPVVGSIKKTTGKVNLIVKGNKMSFKPGETVTLQVLADSDGKNITGFDWLIGYDSTAFSFEKAVSLDENFNLISVKKKEMIIITGTKKVTSNQETVFSNRVVAELNFKVNKTGEYQFSLLSEVGREKTQLVDVNTQIIFPQVNNVVIKVNQ